MEKTVIYKNKPEVFKCHFDVEGVNMKDVDVRLCLIFEDNKNMFFNGNISKDGECVINVPRLNEMGDRNGKMIIEAIADSIYFKLYECDVVMKNSVEVKLEKPSFVSQQEVRINLAEIHKKEPEKKINVMKEPEKKVDVIKEEIEENPYLLHKRIESAQKTFIDFIKKRK